MSSQHLKRGRCPQVCAVVQFVALWYLVWPLLSDYQGPKKVPYPLAPFPFICLCFKGPFLHIVQRDGWEPDLMGLLQPTVCEVFCTCSLQLLNLESFTPLWSQGKKQRVLICFYWAHLWAVQSSALSLPFLGISEGDAGHLQEAAPERAVCWESWFPNTGYSLLQVPSFYLFWATLLRTWKGFPRRLQQSTQKSKRNERNVDLSQRLWFDFLVKVLLWYQVGVISSDKSFRERALLPK